MTELVQALNQDIIAHREALLAGLFVAPFLLAPPLRRFRRWVYA
ncbi:hypothetical protein QOL99_01700 [Deinococcus sp. MIMF12]|uniref:Uncharacterized protein n=1 Tax=Deinococcus rhizophilus TaxID=3049544 RepID=A0ABT7JCU1_9DEIO|nr:hypothetical protein [Deinococcus rhizophilus]MDL2342855.1 hypothetical protein [Deinococcus rhizophilus]